MSGMDETQRFFWMVGILEGEGTFGHPAPSAPNQPRVAVEMTDEDVIRELSALWGVAIFRKAPRGLHKASYRVLLRGRRAAELMRRVLPFMSSRRQARIHAILTAYDVYTGAIHDRAA
jgi:hypothetical protein